MLLALQQLGPALNRSQIFQPDCSAGEIPEDWRSQVSWKTYDLYFTEFVCENSESIGVENTANLSLFIFMGPGPIIVYIVIKSKPTEPKQRNISVNLSSSWYKPES